MGKSYSFLLLLFLINFNIGLKAQVWEGELNGFPVKIPDLAEPVRGAYVMFASNLYTNQDIIDFCIRHNIIMIEKRISNSSPGFSWAIGNEILENLTFLATELNKPEIEFAPLILSGLSASGARATFMSYVPQIRERTLAIVVNNQPYYYGPPEIPQLFLIAGRDGFGSYGYNLEYLGGPARFMATIDKMPFTIAVMPNAEHHRPHDDQSFTTLWLDAIIRHRAPIVPSRSALPLASFHNYSGFVGIFTDGKSNEQPFSSNSSLFRDKIVDAEIFEKKSYTGDSPFIWLPDECTALAWKNFSKTGLPVNYCPCEKIGEECDDGDECTTNTFYDQNCNCIGELLDENQNGICDLYDCIPGSECDDGSNCTLTPLFNNRCICQGTWNDSDRDGVCDDEDRCPGRWDRWIGTYCDVDISGNTTGTYDENCQCVSGCPHAGTWCDDENPETIYSWYDYDCNCIAVEFDLGGPVSNVHSIEKQEKPTVFPNPALNELWWDLNNDFSYYFVSLLDMQGRILISKTLNESSINRFDLSLIPSGIYIVEFKGEKKNYRTKIIKKIN